ncbi:MAG: homoserine kinase, partial [Lachnospiraceae bacterium]|nr:homoserine kinase [Lachnospiraceae bacterium]
MELRVPATSANLGPGFDSLGLALGLYNHFSLKPSKFTSIQIHGEGAKNPKLRVDNV